MMRREAWAGAVRTCVALLVSGITPQPYAGERGPLLERTYSTCSFSMRVMTLPCRYVTREGRTAQVEAS